MTWTVAPRGLSDSFGIHFWIHTRCCTFTGKALGRCLMTRSFDVLNYYNGDQTKVNIVRSIREDPMWHPRQDSVPWHALLGQAEIGLLIHCPLRRWCRRQPPMSPNGLTTIHPGLRYQLRRQYLGYGKMSVFVYSYNLQG